jgi:iron complex transport system ATP-binding protein
LYELKNISFSYKGNQSPVLDDVSLDIKSGELLYLLGPNGCGKSTLLNLLLRILRPDSGEIFLKRKPLSQWKRTEFAREICWVPQMNHTSFAWSVKEMILMARIPWSDMAGRVRREDMEIVDACMDKLAIHHLSERIFHTLSGGEQQMVLLARALAQGGSIILMDEPVTSLDFGNQIRFLEMIKQLSLEGYTMVITSHHPHHIKVAPGRVAMFKKGKIIFDTDSESGVEPKKLASLYDVKIDQIMMLMNGVSHEQEI